MRRREESRSGRGGTPEYYVLQALDYDANGKIVSYAWEGHRMSGVTYAMRYDVRGRLVKKTIGRDPQRRSDEMFTLT